jgi:hypothetical protein
MEGFLFVTIVLGENRFCASAFGESRNPERGGSNKRPPYGYVAGCDRAKSLVSFYDKKTGDEQS